MLRHCVLLTLSDDAPEGQAQFIAEQLRTLPALIPELKKYSVGVDAGVSEGNATIAVIGEFESVAGYRAYSAQADHVRIIGEHIKPHLAARTAVQYHE